MEPDSSGAPRLDTVPLPKVTLYSREQVVLDYSGPCGKGAGMYNMGNTCYLNSTLQALFYIPAFRSYLRHGDHPKDGRCPLQEDYCTICILAATLYSTTQQHTIKPVKVYEKLKVICKFLVHGRQEDAHEFFIYLMASLQKCYLLSYKIQHSLVLDSYSEETTPFNQMFGGYMLQNVVCLQCGQV